MLAASDSTLFAGYPVRCAPTPRARRPPLLEISSCCREFHALELSSSRCDAPADGRGVTSWPASADPERGGPQRSFRRTANRELGPPASLEWRSLHHAAPASGVSCHRHRHHSRGLHHALASGCPDRNRNHPGDLSGQSRVHSQPIKATATTTRNAFRRILEPAGFPHGSTPSTEIRRNLAPSFAHPFRTVGAAAALSRPPRPTSL